MPTDHGPRTGLDRFSLAGRTALVTGSTRGLGHTMARGLAECGAHVVLNGRNADTLDAATAALREDGLDVSRLVGDVTDEAAFVPACERLLAERPVDILVNNVGIHQRAPLEAMSTQQWRDVLDANLGSAFMVSRTVVPGMIDRRRGKIINTCSVMSELGRPTTGNYAAAKGGLKMLTRAMAVEWAKHNVQINGIGPGYFLTDLTKPLADDPEFDRWIKGRTPAGRWGDPEELIGAVVYLASPASDFVNGHVLYVDGGLLAAI